MSDDARARRTAFSSVAAEYDKGRPDHPDAVFDALEPLAGARIADVGAGTGIATRALVERGASVLAVDISVPMLTKAIERSPGLAAVVADGAHLPVPDRSLDLVTFGQSWHWLDPVRRCHEIHRVLRPGGRWAAWWTHARGAEWLERSWDLVEAACPGVLRTQRDTYWDSDVTASGLFRVDERITVAWSRAVAVDEAIADQASRSYIAALAEPGRATLLAQLDELYRRQFPDGVVVVPNETWLWIGHRLDVS